MDSAYRFPSSPGTPLFPVSPERINRQSILASPSCPSEPSRLHDPFSTHRSSDVQGKVAQFNNLNKEAAQRRKDNEAALQRAMMGREEAESETRRLKEEKRALKQELEDGRAKERKVAERVETIMEEMQRMQETQAHSQTLYEKEVRRARKEAFKASSNLVKMQEELKTTRNKFTLMREEAEEQKRKVAVREQEAFAAQYQLVGVQEELDNLKQQMKNLEEERDALKTSLKEEEVARIAAEGKIPLPKSEESDEFSSPKKSMRRESAKENIDPVETAAEYIVQLKAELKMEKKLRVRAMDTIDFMKIECQFGCCSCRVAEQQGKTYIHDSRFDEEISRMASKATKPKPPASRKPRVVSPEPVQAAATEEPLIEFSPATGTFRTVLSPIKRKEVCTPGSISQPLPTQLIDAVLGPTLAPFPLSASPSLLDLSTPTVSAATQSPPINAPPVTPAPLTRLITMTTTTIIPLAAGSPTVAPKSAISFPYSPGTSMTREEALEQIRKRRGRARSVVVGGSTPKRAPGLKRDISAPTGKPGS